MILKQSSPQETEREESRMKVLIGQFVTESNANIPHQCEISDYDIAFGEECIQKMQIRDVFDRHGIDLIPAI